MRILGISALYHDSAAAIVVDGNVIAAAQEERFTRKKHDAGFPRHAIEYCLKEARCDLAYLDAVVFYDKPFLKFERLLQTYVAFAPRGLRSFQMAIPVWLREKLFQKKWLCGRTKKAGSRLRRRRTSCLPNIIWLMRPRHSIRRHLKMQPCW